MTETIAVVKPYYLKEQAYRMGYDKFEGAHTEIPDDEEFDLAPYHGSADYANNVLPKLRAMAGFDDGGHGTYQENRQVAAIEAGAEEDEPAEARLTEAQYVFSELVDAFTAGAYDAADNRDPDPDNV